MEHKTRAEAIAEDTALRVALEFGATTTDGTAFDAACEQFKAICAQIGGALGAEGFRGGFDEMSEFYASEVYGTLQGLQLATAWSAANEYCKYEGRKLGYGQPEWWYRCWGLAWPKEA